MERPVIWVVLLCFSLACVNCVAAGEGILLDLDVVDVGDDGWSAVWDR